MNQFSRAAKTRLQQTAIDVAAQVLSEVDAVAVWKKARIFSIGE